ncbi:MAG: hypothetical protein RLZZ437_3320 [Pseudomonadota bacterium]
MARPIPDPAPRLNLRILATTDLHAHLVGWDYHADCPCEAKGLARLASLLRAARVEAPNSLYFDNGDLIEGSALAEYMVKLAAEVPMDRHPMIAALNALECDAAALGNHEFSYGLAFLQASIRGANYPVLSANILSAKAPHAQGDVPLFAPWAMLDRTFVATDGSFHSLRIGVLGLTPPQVLDWEKAVLDGQCLARDMVEAAAHYVPVIRQAGADLVVVLAHTGIGSAMAVAGGENVGWQIARLPGVDAVVLGHEHQVSAQGKAANAADQPDSTAAPYVMPGAYGSHMGVLDLELMPRDDGQGWMVQRAAAECRPVASRDENGRAVTTVPEDATILAQAEGIHAAARAHMLRPVGASAVPLHSYFAIAHPDAMQSLIAEAQAAYLARLIAGTPWAGLPILSAVAPFKTGGRGGPEFFTDVKPGTLLLRNAADLYVHPNRFAAVVMTGADLRLWLERTASTYAQISPGRRDQPLLNPLFPVTGLEMIAGLSYQIDLTAPACHDSPMAKAKGSAGRIKELRYKGAPLQNEMRFALATNSYRLGVLLGQVVGGPAAVEVIADGRQTPASRDVLLHHLSNAGGVSVPLDWSFCPCPGASVTLDTAPAALAHHHEIAHLAPEPLGLTEDGFLRFRLHL